MTEQALSRRAFLKASALSAALAMAGGLASRGLWADESIAGPIGGFDTQWHKAPCRFCGTGCGVELGVRDGRVVAVRGDEQAAVNKGLLCMKGYHVGLALYGEDRLTTPQLRVNGQLQPISWERALDIIADRIAADPATFAIYGSGQWTISEGYVANKLMKAGLRNNNIDPNARLCMASAAAGYNATYGVDEPTGVYDDLDHCTVLIDWGNNPAEMHPVLFSRVIDRRMKGEKVELIDLTTRYTRTSEFATHVALFKPNTDIAIANGILHELVRMGFLDKPWVEEHFRLRQRVAPYAPDPAKPSVYDAEAIHPRNLAGKDISREDYIAGLAPYTPEAVEEISGVPASLIRRIAKLLADPKQKVMSWWCMGSNQHTRGTAVNCLMHSLHHLSGQWGKPGCGAFSLTGQPSACGTAREVGTFAHLLPGHLPLANDGYRHQVEDMWQVERGRINPQSGLHTVALWDAFCSENGPVSTLWVQVTNPGQTLPDINKLFLRKKERENAFLIVSDVYPTATTALADLILPSAMYVEKNGVYGNAERRQQQWYQMIQPPGQCRDDAWQTVAVARRLYERGLTGLRRTDGSWLFHLESDGQELALWDWEVWQQHNVDRLFFEEYRPFTRIKNKDLAPYDVYAQHRGLRWPVVQDEQGRWRETRWRFVEGSDPFVEEGRGIQFYHSNSKDDRAFIWFHPYEEPPEKPDQAYPLWLTTGRVIEHWHSGSMTMRIPQLRKSAPNAYVEVHPDDASQLGIANGDMVRVISRRGQVSVPAWINGRGKPPQGSAFMPFFDERFAINTTTMSDHCPFSKQPDYKKCAVRIERI